MKIDFRCYRDAFINGVAFIIPGLVWWRLFSDISLNVNVYLRFKWRMISHIASKKWFRRKLHFRCYRDAFIRGVVLSCLCLCLRRCLVSCCIVLSCLRLCVVVVLSRVVLSCPVFVFGLSCLALSCLVLSRVVSFCLVSRCISCSLVLSRVLSCCLAGPGAPSARPAGWLMYSPDAVINGIAVSARASFGDVSSPISL